MLLLCTGMLQTGETVAGQRFEHDNSYQPEESSQTVRADACCSTLLGLPLAVPVKMSRESNYFHSITSHSRRDILD